MISGNSSANSMLDLPAKSIQLASINYLACTQFPNTTVNYLQINQKICGDLVYIYSLMDEVYPAVDSVIVYLETLHIS